MHAVITKRYSVPMVSVRDGLYDIMFNDTAMSSIIGLTREQFMKDHIHPKLAGARVYGAGFVAWAVRHLVTKTLLQLTQHAVPSEHHHFRHHSYTYLNTLPSHHHLHHRRLMGSPSTTTRLGRIGHRLMREQSDDGLLDWLNTGPISSSSSSPDATELAAAPPLPAAVSPVAAEQLDDDTFCAAGEDFEPLAVTNKGWDWVQEGRHDCSSPGCKKYGYKSYTPGSYIEFEFDTSTVLSEDRIEDDDKLALVVLFLKQQSYGIENALGVSDGMGIVRVTCERGCKCEPMEVNGENTDLTAELDTARTEVSGMISLLSS